MSRLAVVLLAALVVSGTAGYAIAQSQRSTTLRACVKKKGGALRAASTCRKGERKVALAQVGPAGATGQPGAVGPAGATGVPGPSGATGPVGAAGTTGAAGTPGANGTPGADGTTSGRTLYAEAGFGANFGGGTCQTTPAGGPSLTFDAPVDSLVQVYATVTMQRTGAATANDVCLNVDGANVASTGLHSTSMSQDTRYLSRGSTSGVTDPYAAEPLVFPVVEGEHTIALRYGSTGGTSNFTSRRLWVTLLQP